MHDGNCVSAARFAGRRQNRFGNKFGTKWSPGEELIQVVPNYVRENFGVSLGSKLVPAAEEAVAKRGIILDDAVVDDGQIPRLIDMRMGIGVARQPMRG